ncbi:MAG: efflux RND transporter periplasmic adaptor subunit [Helicobacteraceae bacterium]|nr:efflux RND transporter periplasmic adaptor subunit [Helicobacteraceae bacterium]
MKQFMTVKSILNLALSGAIALGFTACSTEDNAPQLRPVRTMTLKASNAVSSHTFNGIARSDVAARLSFNVSGRLRSVNIKPGQFVKKGALIAKVDDAYFKLKVAEVRASLKQTASELEHAKARYQRVQKLYVNRSSSLSDLDSARTAYDSAQANRRAMQTRLEQAQLELSYTKLIAPLDGSVSEIHVRKGENISAATNIATISSTKNIEVPISVPGSMIDAIKVGQLTKVRFDALKEQSFNARITEVSHASSMRTTTFPVTVRVIKPSKKIHPGMAASVTYDIGKEDATKSFVIPVHALMEDETDFYIYTVENIEDEVGVIKRHNVSRGPLTGNGIILTNGATEGMKVLTAGMSRVHEDQQVRVR